MTRLAAFVLFLFLLVVARAGDAPAAAAPAREAYVQGLGDVMGAIQARHAKLWFAGEEKNWDLATYEVGVIRDAFTNVARQRPEYQGKPLASMIGLDMLKPLVQVQAAIEAKDPAGFRIAYDGLTTSCNECHRGAGFAFIAIKRPSAPPITNQRYAG
jgi:hypothetical protein